MFIKIIGEDKNKKTELKSWAIVKKIGLDLKVKAASVRSEQNFIVVKKKLEAIDRKKLNWKHEVILRLKN